MMQHNKIWVTQPPAPLAAARGFTLIELMIVVAIAAILLTVGVPSYLATISRYRISVEANGLVGDLQYARSEAVKQGFPVTVCISTDSLTCSSSTTSWAVGHIVVTNPTDPNVAQTVLRAQRSFGGSDTVVPTNGVASIAFNRDGFAGIPTAGTWYGFSSLPQPVYLTIHDASNSTGIGSCVLISPVGQISVLAKGSGGCA